MLQLKNSFCKLITLQFKKVKWHNLRKLEPVSNIFGLDRGTPIDRYYIEQFLKENSQLITGSVCEIAEDTYSKKFGNNITDYQILHYDNTNPKATIIGDLTKFDTLPESILDCFICTQTLNFIYDFKSAIAGIYKMLKPGGMALVTVAGLCQISKYDMERWGDYWRFTTDSMSKAFQEIFNKSNLSIESHGNVLTATAIIQGISAEELSESELLHKDNAYQILITIKAIK